MAAVETDTGGSDADHANGSSQPALDIRNSETWPEMLTVEELALILRSSTRAVQKMIASGEIEAMRGAGRGFRISKRWVIANILHGMP